MRIEAYGDRYLIVQGKRREWSFAGFQRFSKRPSWCSERTAWNAVTFSSQGEAQAVIDEIKKERREASRCR